MRIGTLTVQFVDVPELTGISFVKEAFNFGSSVFMPKVALTQALQVKIVRNILKP